MLSFPLSVLTAACALADSYHSCNRRAVRRATPAIHRCSAKRPTTDRLQQAGPSEALTTRPAMDCGARSAARNPHDHARVPSSRTRARRATREIKLTALFIPRAPRR